MDRAGQSHKKRQYLPASERRRQILGAARTVFARSGLQGARTRELARAAGVNQATLFEHFASKAALFVEAVVQPLTELMAGARERAECYAKADTPESFGSQLQDAVQQHVKSINESFPLLVQALFSDPALGAKLYREHFVPALEAQASAIEEFVADGLEPRLVQLASFGMFFAVVMDKTMTGETMDLDAVSGQLSRLIASGGTTRELRKQMQ